MIETNESKNYKSNQNEQENADTSNKTKTNSRNIHIRDDAGELFVITKCKDLSLYVFTVTAKSPKHFRYTLIAKMHSLCLDLIDNLYSANSVLIKKGEEEKHKKRLDYQIKALNIIRMLEYTAEIAFKQQCIIKKQYMNIGKLGAECTILLNNWIASDKRRVE